MPAPSVSPQKTRKTAVILLNLGTPAAPETGPVRKYLKEFLMDPWVIDIAWPLRWLLVHGAILPRRPALSAGAYRKVWTERGSPLLFHLLDLTERMRERFARTAPPVIVIPAMRYGAPSIESAFCEARDAGADRVFLAPLYPQYSLAATRSSVDRAQAIAREVLPQVKLESLPPFYADAGFLDAFAAVGKRAQAEFHPDFVLFSFHGLPERQVRKTDPSGQHCFATPGCCDRITDANRDCYRAHCFHTARELARRMGLSADRFAVSFQSRLGRTPWIKPYTDQLLDDLVKKKGVRRLAVMCPAFVADCLETLEEIGIRARESFIASGGEELCLVPSLNSEARWADALHDMIQSRLQK